MANCGQCYDDIYHINNNENSSDSKNNKQNL